MGDLVVYPTCGHAGAALCSRLDPRTLKTVHRRLCPQCRAKLPGYRPADFTRAGVNMAASLRAYRSH